jgi:hypothetical protein
MSKSQSQSHVTTDGQSVGLGVKSTLELVGLSVAELSLWGALSDERQGLSLVSDCQIYLVLVNILFYLHVLCIYTI